MTLSGEWQLALLEVWWPAMVCIVTEGKLTVSESVPSPVSPVYSTNQIFPSGRPGIVLMRMLPQFRKESPMNYSTPEVHTLHRNRLLLSVGDIMDAIMKSATRNSKAKILPPYIQQNKDAPSLSSISGKGEKGTQELRVKFCGILEMHGLVMRAISQDFLGMKNILGRTTIIDCQNAEQRQK